MLQRRTEEIGDGWFLPASQHGEARIHLCKVTGEIRKAGVRPFLRLLERV